MNARLWHRRFDSPIGPCELACIDTGLCALEFLADDEANLDRALPSRRTRGIAARRRLETAGTRHSILDDAEHQIRAYFAGRLHRFELPLAPHATDFQAKVWDALTRIPFGQTRAYADIADQLHAPRATRAVGHANGTNPIAIIIPCHRVIGRSGQLVGYGGGLHRKRWLLQHEATPLFT